MTSQHGKRIAVIENEVCTILFRDGTISLEKYFVLEGFWPAYQPRLCSIILNRDHCLQFGEVDIDGSLVASHSSVAEDIVMVNNGCLCCTVRGDLVKMLLELAKNKRDKFDHIVIETTGIFFKFT